MNFWTFTFRKIINFKKLRVFLKKCNNKANTSRVLVVKHKTKLQTNPSRSKIISRWQEETTRNNRLQTTISKTKVTSRNQIKLETIRMLVDKPIHSSKRAHKLDKSPRVWKIELIQQRPILRASTRGSRRMKATVNRLGTFYSIKCRNLISLEQNKN